MITKWVFQLSRWAEWVSALFVLAVALRFSGTAFANLVGAKLKDTQAAVEVPRLPNPGGVANSQPQPASSLELLRALKAHLPPLPDENTPDSDNGRAEHKERTKFVAGEAVQVQLMVSLPPDRSEIMVNGTLVGRSPFIGDVACRVGDKVRIDVIPEKGMPVSVERLCVPEVIRVDRSSVVVPSGK